MKVLYVTMRFPLPSETFAAVEVAALRRAGVKVSVHTLRPKPRFSDRMLAERGLVDLRLSHNSLGASARGLTTAIRRPRLAIDLLNFILRGTASRPEQFAKSLVLLPRALELFERIEREGPDVVHLYWGHYPSLVGYLVQRCLPLTVLSTSLGAYDLLADYGCGKVVAREADVVRTIARANVPALKAFGVSADHIAVSYDGVDLDRAAAATPQKVKYRLLAVERLVREKCTDDVLRAFRELLERWPGATLVVLGDGPERRRLENMCASMGLTSAVTFQGHVSQQEVFEHMAKAEALLSMSQNPSERLPNAVKEAMHRRCLCVVTETKGIEELVADGEEGFVVPPGDIGAAAEKIDRLFSDAVLGERMAEAACRRVRHHFDVDRLIQARIARWRELSAAKAETGR